jgi:hypothetical protein
MVFAGLSLDQAPPYASTVKFFITGFAYATLAGLYLLFLQTTFYNAAFIHLLTLGFAAHVMFGAVFQFLPVVGGITFKRVRMLTNVVYASLNFGIIAFIGAFTTFASWLFIVAAALLFCTVFTFGLSVIYKVISQKTKNISIISIAFAVFFLLIGTFLAGHMLATYAFSLSFETLAAVKSLHLHLLLYGWTLLLVAGVSFQVIPMFWVAQDFSKNTKTLFVFSLAGLLLIYALASFLNEAHLVKPFILIYAIIYAVSITVRLQNRKRKLQDFSVNYWFIAMGALIVSSVLLLLGFDYEGALVFGYGFFYGVICAMIYKIIPFLTWFFLSAKGVFDIPTMKEMVAQKNMQNSFYLYIATFIMLLLTPFLNVTAVFALLFTGLNLYHLYNLLGVVSIYKKFS